MSRVRKCPYCGGLMGQMGTVPDWLNPQKLIAEGHPMPLIGNMMAKKADTFVRDVLQNRIDVWKCSACGHVAIFERR